MALNNRIYKYTCDVCKRSIERLADPTRPDPLRCVITDQCEGKLSLTGTRFGLRPSTVPTVIGLLDRVKRGTVKDATVTAKALDRVSISSFNGSNGLTLGVLQSVETLTERLFFVYENGVQRVLERIPLTESLAPSFAAVTASLFELTPAALEYKRYTYNRTERCVFVQGRDDSAAQALLAFNDTSNVRVFVNGELLSSTLYDKTVAGTITFTPELEEPSLLIEIFVYKSLTQFYTDDQAIKLKFISLAQYDPLRTACAWGDAAKASKYVPLYCADISALDRSKTYGLVKLEAVDEAAAPVTVDADGCFFLANPPYAFQDKRLTATVPLAALISEGFSISFTVDEETGSTFAVVDGETLSPLSRALNITTLSSSLSSTQAAETVSLVVPRNERSFIIGPT